MATNWSALSARDWTATATFALAIVTVWMGWLSKRGLDAEERREKSRRMPFVVFEFSDVEGHENLGAVGFRHLESKPQPELLISGRLRNVGNSLALGLRLDIYHFLSSDGPPVHEIAGLPISDAIPPGGTLEWSRSIGLKDLAVNGFYRSGIGGLFAVNPNCRHYHFHVVFSYKNADGEKFSSIYFMTKLIRAREFTGNEMTFAGMVSDKYDPERQFPKEWRAEIRDMERAQTNALKSLGERPAPTDAGHWIEQ